MNTSHLTPATVRIILIIIMLLLVVIGGAAFIYGRDLIKQYAVDAQETSQKAKASSNELRDLQNMKTTLEQKHATVERAAQLTSNSKLYVYQDKIIDDITKYANDAGLRVKNITFSDPKAATAASSASASGATTATTVLPASIKSRIATVTLDSPVDYYKMLNFIHSIEQGLFRMRVAQVGLSRDGKGNVTSDVLNIEVYVHDES